MLGDGLGALLSQSLTLGILRSLKAGVGRNASSHRPIEHYKHLFKHATLTYEMSIPRYVTPGWDLAHIYHLNVFLKYLTGKYSFSPVSTCVCKYPLSSWSKMT